MSAKVETIFWKSMSLGLMALILFAIGISFYYPWEKPLFVNADFAKGDLTNWTAQGDAFSDQPTLGDNPLYRGRPSVHNRGKYWIGTFENHHRADQPLGQYIGDGPTGTLTSIPFVIERDKIGFLIGAGDSSRNEMVSLEVEGKVVLNQSGWGNTMDSETMSRIIWDVSPWKGKKARIIIIDNATGPWGHINAGDFRYL